MGYIHEDIGRKVRKQKFTGKKKGIISIEELLRIIDLETPRKRAKVVVLLGALAGLRRGEMKGLRWGCVDMENHILEIKKEHRRH